VLLLGPGVVYSISDKRDVSASFAMDELLLFQFNNRLLLLFPGLVCSISDMEWCYCISVLHVSSIS